MTSAESIAVLACPLELWTPGVKHIGYIAIAQRQWREEQHPDRFYLGYGHIRTTLYYRWPIGLADGEVTFYKLPAGDQRPAQWLHLVTLPEPAQI